MALQLNRSGKDKSAASTSGTGKPARGSPVTANPLFPAVVALWFGALFGLGSLAVRVGLLESLVLATRIDLIIPSAAPPLGISARILLALVLAALGALLGTVIARRIAAPKPVVRERKRKASLSPDETVHLRSRDAHPDAPARRPLSINDAIGDAAPEQEQTAADPLAGRRRSALAIETDDTFELHELAPLPGGNPQILPRSNSADAPFADAPLELGAYAEAAEAQVTPPALDWHNAASPAAPTAYNPDPLPNFSPPSDALSGRQVFGMTHPQPDEVLDQLGITDAEFEPLPTADVESGSAPAAAVVPADSDPATMPMTYLAKRLAESMQRRRARVAEAATTPTAALASYAQDAAAVPVAMAEAVPPPRFSPLGLVPDLAPAIEPDQSAAPSFSHPNDIPIPPAPVLPAASEPAATSEPLAAPVPGLSFAAPTLACFSKPEPSLPVASQPAPHQPLFGGGGHTVPAGLRPLSFDALPDDDDGEALVSFLPPRSFPGVGLPQPLAAAPAVPFEAPAAAIGDDESASADKFSSLLELGRNTEPRQTFVRIEDSAEPAVAIEPVVIFPGQVARHSADSAMPTEFDPAAGSFRQFDSPSSADAGQDVAPAASAPHDQGETERALRAALANLQRMSGAA